MRKADPEPALRVDIESAISRARTLLGDIAVTKAFQQAQTQTIDQAVAHALRQDTPAPTALPRSA